MAANSKETLRRKMKRAGNAKPSHVSKRVATEKYQCNGPTSWRKQLQALADKIAGRKGADMAIGVRAALAKGLGVRVREGDVNAVDLLPGAQTKIPGTVGR